MYEWENLMVKNADFSQLCLVGVTGYKRELFYSYAHSLLPLKWKELSFDLGSSSGVAEDSMFSPVKSSPSPWGTEGGEGQGGALPLSRENILKSYHIVVYSSHTWCPNQLKYVKFLMVLESYTIPGVRFPHLPWHLWQKNKHA